MAFFDLLSRYCLSLDYMLNYTVLENLLVLRTNIHLLQNTDFLDFDEIAGPALYLQKAQESRKVV